MRVSYETDVIEIAQRRKLLSIMQAPVASLELFYYIESMTKKSKEELDLLAEAFMVDFMARVGKTKKANRAWRTGQTMFNVLHDIRPDLSEQIRGSHLDPFYLESKVQDFTDWVRKNCMKAPLDKR